MANDLDEEFEKAVLGGMLPKLRDAHVAITLVPKDQQTIDVKWCVELGAMIMLDKPILAIAHPDVPLPPKLELVADKIVHADIMTSEGRALLDEALADFGITKND